MRRSFLIKLLVANLLLVVFCPATYAQNTSTNDSLYIGIYGSTTTPTNEQILRYNTTNDAATIASEAPVPWLGSGNTIDNTDVRGEGIAVGQNYSSDPNLGNIADPVFIANANNETIEVANAQAAATANPIVNSNLLGTGYTPSGLANIALSPNGQDLYVAEQTGTTGSAGGTGTGVLAEFNALTGAYITSVALPDAHDVVVNANGNVFVTAYAAGAGVSTGVEEYNASLTTSTNFIAYNYAIGTEDGTNVTLNHATGMTFDSSGDLWVANVSTSNNTVRGLPVGPEDFVSEFSPTGALLKTYYASGTNLYVVFGLSLGPNGDIYAASFSGNEITQINPTTGVVSTYISLPDGDTAKYAVWGSDSVTFSTVPEPRTYGLMTLGGGVFLLAFRLLRRTLRTAVQAVDPRPQLPVPRRLKIWRMRSRLAPTTCCRGAETETSTKAQEAAQAALATASCGPGSHSDDVGRDDGQFPRGAGPPQCAHWYLKCFK